VHDNLARAQVSEQHGIEDERMLLARLHGGQQVTVSRSGDQLRPRHVRL
jgi:hypothetical protein